LILETRWPFLVEGGCAATGYSQVVLASLTDERGSTICSNSSPELLGVRDRFRYLPFEIVFPGKVSGLGPRVLEIGDTSGVVVQRIPVMFVDGSCGGCL
jgi:hypothetical protein